MVTGLLDLLVGGKRPRLGKQLVDERPELFLRDLGDRAEVEQPPRGRRPADDELRDGILVRVDARDEQVTLGPLRFDVAVPIMGDSDNDFAFYVGLGQAF